MCITSRDIWLGPVTNLMFSKTYNIMTINLKSCKQIIWIIRVYWAFTKVDSELFSAFSHSDPICTHRNTTLQLYWLHCIDFILTGNVNKIAHMWQLVIYFFPKWEVFYTSHYFHFPCPLQILVIFSLIYSLGTKLWQ